MKQVLVLGSGLVVRPLVAYLHGRGHRVTLASRTLARAEAVTAGMDRARAVQRAVAGEADIDDLVADHDLVVSMLPAPLHPAVARACIGHRAPLVTTSYISPAMRALDADARAAGVPLLNELGLDPGIDHMSAMAIIHRCRDRGARVVGFTSYCGGLPAPEANDNPLGYKFSWSPRGVLTAATNAARYLRDGAVVETPGPELFTDYRRIEVRGPDRDGGGDGGGEVMAFEGYPNRDSVAYRDVYGLSDARTLLRGTLRNVGHCETWKGIVDLGLLDDTARPLAGMTYRDVVAAAAGIDARAGADVVGARVGADDPLAAALAARLGVAADATAGATVIAKLRWLGMLDDEPVGLREGSALDVLAARMWQRMQYAPGERDMIVLEHTFDIVYSGHGRSGGHAERLTSTLVAYGEPDGDTAMARTVALPAAIGAQLILDGAWAEPGVQSPVVPALYEPLLSALAEAGVAFREVASPVS